MGLTGGCWRFVSVTQGDPELVSAIYGRGMAYGKKSLQVSNLDETPEPVQTVQCIHFFVLPANTYGDEITRHQPGLGLAYCSLHLWVYVSHAWGLGSLCTGHKERRPGSVRAQPRHHPGAKLAWGVWTESRGEAQPCALSKSHSSPQQKKKKSKNLKGLDSL